MLRQSKTSREKHIDLRYAESLMSMEESIPELADQIFREKVMRARRQTIAERFETGLELFEKGIAQMRSGIRHQFPNASDEEVRSILRKRLRRSRQLDEHGLFRKESG